MFESLEGNDRQGIAKRLTSMLVSICLHGVIITLVVVLPLIFLNAMPEGILLSFLMAEPAVPKTPEPPAPPPPAASQANTVKVQMTTWNEKFYIPDRIPAPDLEPVVFGAVPSNAGIGLGSSWTVGLVGTSGITGWGLVSAAPPLLPPPPAPLRNPVVRTGGTVQEAKLIKRVVPEYPVLAKNARVQDVVILEVALDEEGNVVTVRVVKGHPLLVDEAVRAVKQWKYSPTLLNGEPVPVISTVTLIFRLN